jgi:hypothetical protein
LYTDVLCCGRDGGGTLEPKLSLAVEGVLLARILTVPVLQFPDLIGEPVELSQTRKPLTSAAVNQRVCSWSRNYRTSHPRGKARRHATEQRKK